MVKQLSALYVFRGGVWILNLPLSVRARRLPLPVAENGQAFAFDKDNPIYDVRAHMQQVVDFVTLLAMLRRIGPKDRDVRQRAAGKLLVERTPGRFARRWA